VCACPFLAALAVLSAVVVAPASAAELPLGPASLDERRTARELAPGLRWTRIARGEGGSRWRVHVLSVDRAGGAKVVSLLSNGRVRGRERLSRIARRAGALAAVNGGFFASRGLTDGDPVGALALRGRLVSESVDGRPALLVPRDPARAPRIARLRFRGRVRIGGRRRALDGVNRAAGLIPGCGGRGGDRPTERPSSTLLCRDRSELVLMTRDFAARTPRRRGATELVVRDGRVTALRRGGRSRIPAGGFVLTGTGGAARYLRAASPGDPEPAVSARLRRGRTPVGVAGLGALVSGDPLLVSGGRPRVRGRGTPAPRTLAGVRRDGTLLLVTIDGRTSRSAGATLREAARVMRSLGARQALALDGGGSTTMTVGRRVVNTPSDGRQRSIGDALGLLP